MEVADVVDQPVSAAEVAVSPAPPRKRTETKFLQIRTQESRQRSENEPKSGSCEQVIKATNMLWRGTQRADQMKAANTLCMVRKAGILFQPKIFFDMVAFEQDAAISPKEKNPGFFSRMWRGSGERAGEKYYAKKLALLVDDPKYSWTKQAENAGGYVNLAINYHADGEMAALDDLTRCCGGRPSEAEAALKELDRNKGNVDEVLKKHKEDAETPTGTCGNLLAPVSSVFNPAAKIFGRRTRESLAHGKAMDLFCQKFSPVNTEDPDAFATDKERADYNATDWMFVPALDVEHARKFRMNAFSHDPASSSWKNLFKSKEKRGEKWYFDKLNEVWYKNVAKEHYKGSNEDDLKHADSGTLDQLRDELRPEGVADIFQCCTHPSYTALPLEEIAKLKAKRKREEREKSALEKANHDDRQLAERRNRMLEQENLRLQAEKAARENLENVERTRMKLELERQLAENQNLKAELAELQRLLEALKREVLPGQEAQPDEKELLLQQLQEQIRSLLQNNMQAAGSQGDVFSVDEPQAQTPDEDSGETGGGWTFRELEDDENEGSCGGGEGGSCGGGGRGGKKEDFTLNLDLDEEDEKTASCCGGKGADEDDDEWDLDDDEDDETRSSCAGGAKSGDAADKLAPSKGAADDERKNTVTNC
eukprot:g18270.t1